VTFEVVTVVLMKIMVFWNVTQCSLADGFLQNIGTYLRKNMVSHPRRQRS